MSLYNDGGPVGWWRFDYASGTSAYDSSGEGNTGSFGGDPTHTFTDCADGFCLDFDGSNDWINAGQVLPTDKTKPFTLVAWAKPDSSGMSTWRTILGTHSSYAEIAFSSSNVIRFGQNGG